jgi:hypothetical protein
MEHQINKKVTVILSAWIALLFIWIGGVAYITDRIEQGYRDSIYYYKVMQSPIRALSNYDITEDTAYIRKLEKSTKELMKRLK